MSDMEKIISTLEGAVAALQRLQPTISGGTGSVWSAACPDCGAPMQVVSVGRAECSVACWRGSGDAPIPGEIADELDDLSDRMTELEHRLSVLEARPGHGFGYTRGHSV